VDLNAWFRQERNRLVVTTLVVFLRLHRQKSQRRDPDSRREAGSHCPIQLKAHKPIQRSDGDLSGDAPHLTVYVRHAQAIDWLQHRLMPVITRTVRRQAGSDVEIAFTANV
jgi:hypothetical protein